MPKPAAVSDLDKFLSLLEKSTLLSADQMASVRQTAAGHEEAKALARYLIKTGVLTKWQAMQLLAGWNAFRIDKYHLLTQIGSGQHSRMYLAEHRAMGRKVILRTLPRRSAERPDLLRRFLKDAQAASALDHRNIIHVYDVNSEGDRYFVVMEHVEGRTLFDMVAEDGPLTPSQAVDYLRQAADGLAYAHEQGLVHRELSPGKLIVDEQRQVKILDMGISGLDEPSESASTDVSGGATSAGAYLAPEQCQANPQADERSDIYSLGATLYYLLSGKSPLAPSAAQKPQDLVQLRSDVPVSLVELCQRMMATAPADRVASATELKTLLEQWLAQQRPTAPPIRRKPAAATEEAAPVLAGAKAAAPRTKVAKPIAEEATEPAPAAIGAFPAFDAGAPRKLSKTSNGKAKKASVAPASKDSDDGKTEVAAKKPLPLALILGVSGGVVALLIIAGLTTALLMQRGNQPIATNTADATKKDKTTAKAPPATDKKVEAPAIAPPAVEKPVENPPAPEVAPMEAPVEPMPEPAPAPAVSEAAADPAPTVEPMPEELKPEPPPELAPKPEPKPEPKTEPKPPMIEPFAEVAKAVDLPSLGLPTKPNPMALTPVALGPVKLEKDGVIFLRLIGGEKATSGKSTLTLSNAGNDPNAWEIIASDTRANTQVVAQLALKDGNLGFVWTPEATQSPQLCAGLINCAIGMANGPKAHKVALRKPIEVAPLAVNLEKPLVKSDREIPYGPDPSTIKVEILKIEGKLKATTDKALLVAEKDFGFITFGEKPAEQLLMMKVDSLTRAEAMKHKVSVVLTPHLKTDAGPVKFTVKQLLGQKNLVTAQQNQLVAQIQAMRAAKSKEEEIKRAEGVMTRLNEAMAKFTAVETQLESVNAAQVHFRIYYAPSEEEQIDLVTSTAQPAAAPAAKVPGGEDIPKLDLGKEEE